MRNLEKLAWKQVQTADSDTLLQQYFVLDQDEGILGMFSALNL